MLRSKTNRQTGGILITALVVVVIVTVLATSIQRDYYRSITLVESTLSRQGAALVMDSTPDLIETLLASDQDHQVDSLADRWLQPLNAMPVAEGLLSAQISDANGKLNLNSVATGGDAGEEFTVAQRRLIRLLQTFDDLALSQYQAEQLVKALKDYIDEDDFVVDFESAETEYYAALSPVGYRSSNQLLESISELRFVRYFTPEIIQRLTPFVTVLPHTASGFNVNTASSNVLRTLNTSDDLSPLDPSMVISWEESRTEQPFVDEQSFASTPTIQQLQSANRTVAMDDLLYASDYIELAVDLRWRDRLYLFSALLERDEQRVKLIKKTNGIL